MGTDGITQDGHRGVEEGKYIHFMKFPFRSVWWDGAIIILVFIWGYLWKFQGWNENRLNNFDILPYYIGAYRWITDGVMLDHGDRSSYDSFSPPGTVYLIAPALIVVADPRLQEILATIIPNVLELIFLYLLVRPILGRLVAVSCVVAVGISRMGLLGLWPIGHPAYVLGCLYFLFRWIQNRESWACAGAILFLAFGLYVDLAILPAVIAAAVIWLFYRPPIRWKPVFIAVFLSVAIWFPYLRFEWQRGFRDILSILYRQPVVHGQVVSSTPPPYCNASLLGISGTWSGSYADLGFPDQGSEYVVYPGNAFMGSLKYQLCRLFVNLDRNFDAHFFVAGFNPFLNTVLWFFFFTGMMVLFFMAFWEVTSLAPLLRRILAHPKILAASTLCVSALLLVIFQEGVLSAWLESLGKLNSEWLGILAQCRAFLPIMVLAISLGLWLSQAWEAKSIRGIGLLAIGIWVMWLLLLFLAEPDRELRFWWFWPFEVLAMIIAAVALGKRLFSGHALSVILSAFICIGVLPLPFLWERTGDWIAEGYSGIDPGQLSAVEYLGKAVKSEGKSSAFIGYQLLTFDFATLSAETKDPILRAGAWFDYLFESREQIINENRSVQGLDPSDEFRIYELSSDCSPSQIPGSPPWPGFIQEAVFRCYAIYRKVQ